MNSKFLTAIGCLAIAWALTACSSEEMADSTQLPEGKYPITFTATGLEVTPVTRATADGEWTENDKVAVHLKGGSYDEARQYKVSTTDGNTATLVCVDDKGPFYWQSASDSYDVKAWSNNGIYTNFPTVLNVGDDQSMSNYYPNSDFLYAHGTLSYDGNKSLTFYHQTAKVVVHVISGSDTPEGMSIDDMKTRVLCFRANSWSAPTGEEHYGTCTPSYESYRTEHIWPLAFDAGEITLPSGSKAQAMKSYKFLIVPQTVTADGSALFIINPNGTAYNYIPTSNITWEAGREYTYYITIKGSKVTATVSTSIGWAEGATGAGSVEIE